MKIRSGPWDRSAIESFLAETVIPVRLATVGGSGPLVQSMWFLYRDGSVWCSTQRTSVLCSRLTADPRCGFEVAADSPPYRGVRGRGVATFDDADPGTLLETLIDRYLGDGGSLRSWLLSQVADEVSVRISDLTVVSWDYSGRMG